MTAHVMKPGLFSELSTYCGISLVGGKGKKSKKSDTLGFASDLPNVDCVGCLRGLLVDERIKTSGMEDNKYTRWLFGGSTGTSSITIWAVMTQTTLTKLKQDIGVPHDPSDFARCHDLLETFPEWRPRLPEVAALYPKHWEAMIAAWDELTALYLEERDQEKAPKLYARLKELGG